MPPRSYTPSTAIRETTSGHLLYRCPLAEGDEYYRVVFRIEERDTKIPKVTAESTRIIWFPTQSANAGKRIR